jgi:hypothetical protein
VRTAECGLADATVLHLRPTDGELVWSVPAKRRSTVVHDDESLLVGVHEACVERLG